MTEPRLLDVDAALALVLGRVRTLEHESVALRDARGRYLAQELVAARDAPPFTSSAMDGFALRHEDTPGVIELVGESAAGAPFTGSVGAGQGVVISTGAVLPDGCDTVVPIEWVPSASPVATGPAPSTATIEVRRRAPPDFAVRPAGSDVRAGATVVPAGVRLGAVEIGAAASLGSATLRCTRRPTVALLTTGSELVAGGETLGPGQIYDSNGPLLHAALEDAGAEVVVVRRAADTPAEHRAALADALACDVALSTGGVSVGGHDLVRDIARELGVEELFWRVALKPGKPLSFGVRPRPGLGRDVLVFGIPGNPVSVLVCFELFVRPALRALQGARHPQPGFARARLAAAVARNPERVELIRVRVAPDGRLEPLSTQQSHQLALSARADGLARIPPGSGTLAAGACVDYLSLRES